MSALLQVENLKTYFFTRRGIGKAVDGVSFSVNEGESLGLVGESGCGKSITCLSILRLVPAPAGRIVDGKILFQGKSLLDISESEMRRIRGSKIAMILQDPNMSLNPVFTIGEQVAEAIRLHQKANGESVWSRVIEALKLVQIPAAERRLKDYPHQMSGGMRQRVVGAISVSCQPSLLIADEPTTSLDVTVQEQYLALLKKIQLESRVAMIFITHDFGVLARMCDRVAVMYAGKIVEKASVRDIFNQPRHPYTVALLGCLPKLEGESEYLTCIEGQPPDVINLPDGCPFAPRCSQVKELCRRQYPAETEAGAEHTVSCWAANS